MTGAVFLSRRTLLALAATALAGTIGLQPGAAIAQADPLPSWNQGPVKQSILKFVDDVTRAGSSTFVPVPERIAVFDNDGTLWAEQPIYFQVQFSLDRVKALAPQHPEWNERQPFKAVIDGDLKALAASGTRGLGEVVMATQTGMTTEEFARITRDWLATARHPRFNRAYTELIYQPMGELLAYLRANGFKTFIVSGGETAFMRVFTERVYGIPPEQVVGSTVATRFELRNSKPVLVRLPKIDFIDDGPGKPVGIEKFIGRWPIFAFGNSDGDLQMLQYTALGSGARFVGLVHHTDAEREWAYDRTSHVGKLDEALDEANQRGWTVVDMKRDWRTVFPPAPAAGSRALQ